MILLIWNKKKYHISIHNLHKNFYSKNKWFKSTLYSIGDGIITTDTEDKILQMNSMAERLTGFIEAEAIGMKIDTVFRITDINNTSTNNDILFTRSLVKVNSLLFSKNGLKYPISLLKSPILYNNSDFLGSIFIFRDLTEDFEKEQLVSQMNERLAMSELASKSGSWEYELKTRKLRGSVGANRIFDVENEVDSLDEIIEMCLPDFK